MLSFCSFRGITQLQILNVKISSFWIYKLMNYKWLQEPIYAAIKFCPISSHKTIYVEHLQREYFTYCRFSHILILIIHFNKFMISICTLILECWSILQKKKFNRIHSMYDFSSNITAWYENRRIYDEINSLYSYLFLFNAC